VVELPLLAVRKPNNPISDYQLGDDAVHGRFVIETRHRRHDWEVIVEPDPLELLLVVVTAYAIERRQQ